MVLDEHEDAPRPKPRRSAWKLPAGIFLVFLELKNWLTPRKEIPAALQADNVTQQITIQAVSTAIFIVGVWLIIAGVRAFRRTPAE